MKATTVLVRQHRRIEQLLAVLQHERFFRASLLLDLFEELTAHFEAERSVVLHDAEWGAAGRMGTYGDTVAEAVAAMNALGELVGDDAAFAAKLLDLRRIIDEHVALEEGALLPAIETRLSEHALEVIGREVEAAHAEALRSCRGHDAGGRPSVVGREPRPAVAYRRRWLRTVET